MINLSIISVIYWMSRLAKNINYFLCIGVINFFKVLLLILYQTLKITFSRLNIILHSFILNYIL